jgi:hypothetical protein
VGVKQYTVNLTETKRARRQSGESAEIATMDSEEGREAGDGLVDGRVWQIESRQEAAGRQDHNNTSTRNGIIKSRSGTKMGKGFD